MTHQIDNVQSIMIWVTCAHGLFYNLMVPQPPAVVPGQGTQLEMPDIPRVKPKWKVKPKESKEKPKEEVSTKKKTEGKQS